MEITNADNVKQVLDMVQNGVNTLSEQMGVALPHLWGVLVKQQIVDGVTGLIWILILVASVIFFLKKLKDAAKDYDDYSTAAATIAGVWLFFLIMALLASGIFTNTIGKLINPEYYAIQEVVSYIKQ